MAIYLISDGELVKIGYSQNPIRRLNQLQTGHPKKLKLIKIFDYSTAPSHGKITEKLMEKKIHYLLRRFKVRYNGEWFYFRDYSQLIDIITEILNHS